jgi:hypothetical protein
MNDAEYKILSSLSSRYIAKESKKKKQGNSEQRTGENSHSGGRNASP